jgi:hypothetical protein
MITKTSERVEQNTSDAINQQQAEYIQSKLRKYSGASKFALDRRLKKLEREWTTERAIELEAPMMIAVGAGLTYWLGRKWLALPLFSAGMLLLHGIKGWYPLLPLMRRLGLRSQNEILREREGLKALRGDDKEYQIYSRSYS